MSCFQDSSLLELSNRSWLESPDPSVEKEVAAPTGGNACSDRGGDDLSRGGKCRDGSGADHSGKGDDKMSSEASMAGEATNLATMEVPNLCGDGPQAVTSRMEKGAATNPIVVVVAHYSRKEIEVQGKDVNVAVD